jgi:putative iron-regulated protein
MCQPALSATKTSDVLKTYADIALAAYQDALTSAQSLQAKIKDFLAKPGDETLKAAKTAWLAARVPYQQTEVYRFGNTIVDDWEGKVNAWPLDEGLIDYVDASYGTQSEENELYTANVIASPKMTIGGKEIDASKITKELIAEMLHEAGKIEANVATGYHVIEFLLWGQDLNGTGPGNGERPATDFSLETCTGGNCDRRREYLQVATDLLIDDLTWIVAQWKEDGEARKTLMADETAGVVAIFTGLGSLSYGELAGERMKLGLLLHDPEEEHDCFADNTHNSHYYNVVGMRNVYSGSYKRLDGSTVIGPSISDLVNEAAPDADKALRAQLDATLAAFAKLKERAETVEAYDQMIGEGNEEGNTVVQAAIDALLAQTKSIERAVAALKLNAIQFEGSDSLDNPSAVGTKSNG